VVVVRGSTLPGVLILHFDYPSAASAVAVLRVQRVADEGGEVHFSGFDVLGLDRAIPPTLDQLAEIERLRDQLLAASLPVRRPSRHPPTLAAHVVGDLAEEHGLGAAWRLACLRAYWADDADLGDLAVLRHLARGVGLDPDQVRERLEDREVRLDRRRRGWTLRGRGIGGVPVLEVDGTLLAADLPHERLRELAAL
jgi:2-hydroxychromene-2-carboxylate isomerase